MTIDLRDSPMAMVREIDGATIDVRPLQGLWTEEQYLVLTDHTNQLVEYSDGVIEVLPMPTDYHQAISFLISRLLLAFIEGSGGVVRYSPLRLQIRSGKQREPDILLLRDANDPRRQNRFWLGADLVVEIVSEDNPDRDLVEKVADYAEAAIPEYWIVNPLDQTITVLALNGTTYATHGVFRRGEHAASATLEGFTIDVNAVFDVK